MRVGPRPVIIAGAGPTGLALALELARFDVPVRIVDRAVGPAEHSQAIAIQARTLELLEASGVSDRLASHAHRVSGLRVDHGSSTIATLTFDAIPSKYRWIAIVPQSTTERVMTQRLREFGVEIERGVELIALDERDDRVDVTLRGPGGDERISTPYLAGCDGAHSAVRKLTRRQFGGHTVDEHLVLADAALTCNLPPSRAYVHVHDSAGVAAFFPMEPGRWRVIVVGAGDAALDRRSLQALIDAHGLDAQVDDVSWSSPFRVNQRRVDTYASPRVYLLGDAAHIHSPIGGQGMNSGIGDAVNLGWKIALTLHERLGPRLLETYALERAPVGRTLLQMTNLGNRLMFSPPPWLGRIRDTVAPYIVANHALRARVAETIAQLRIAYPRSPLSVGDGRQQRCIAGNRVQGARLAGYRPQPIVLPADDDGPALTLVVRPDGYHGYVGYGVQPSGAAIYLREVIGVGDALRVPA